MNKREAKCAGCWRMLAPGRGLRWLEERPLSAKSGKYVCQGCAEKWRTYNQIMQQARERMEEGVCLINRKLPAAPVMDRDPEGNLYQRDQRGLAVELALGWVLDRMGVEED